MDSVLRWVSSSSFPDCRVLLLPSSRMRIPLSAPKSHIRHVSPSHRFPVPQSENGEDGNWCINSATPLVLGDYEEKNTWGGNSKSDSMCLSVFIWHHTHWCFVQRNLSLSHTHTHLDVDFVCFGRGTLTGGQNRDRGPSFHVVKPCKTPAILHSYSRAKGFLFWKYMFFLYIK